VVYISFLYDVNEALSWGYVILPICFFYSGMQLVFEIKQVKNEGKEYF
jgi:hypothetical protein